MTARFEVYEDFGGCWWVRTDSELAGPYPTEEDALADFEPVPVVMWVPKGTFPTTTIS